MVRQCEREGAGRGRCRLCVWCRQHTGQTRQCYSPHRSNCRHSTHTKGASNAHVDIKGDVKGGVGPGPGRGGEPPARGLARPALGPQHWLAVHPDCNKQSKVRQTVVGPSGAQGRTRRVGAEPAANLQARKAPAILLQRLLQPASAADQGPLQQPLKLARAHRVLEGHSLPPPKKPTLPLHTPPHTCTTHAHARA